MGSVLAGARAGAVASLYFAGSVSLFNLLLLYSFKTQVLAYLAQNYPSTCSAAATSSSTGSAESCFTDIVINGVVTADFLRVAVIGMVFALVIGLYFDQLPGRSYLSRALLASLVMLIGMLFLGLYGLVIDETQALLMILFQSGSAFLYAAIIARLYRHFTREIEFQNPAKSVKVLVDGRDVTGKKRTFTVNSNHKLELGGDQVTFKGWSVSGGLTVKEPKEQKTTLRVTGDGILKVR